MGLREAANLADVIETIDENWIHHVVPVAYDPAQ